jgi:hypothetical protein
MSDKDEEKQTAREMKIIIIVFIVGILVSYLIQSFYGKQYYKMGLRISALSIYMLISAMLGRIIWNGYITELFPFVKPAPSFEYILGLMIFSGLVLNF